MCGLLYGVLLCSAPSSSVAGVGTSDECDVDAMAVEYASVQCVGEKRNRLEVCNAESGECTSEADLPQCQSELGRITVQAYDNNGVKVRRVRKRK